MNSKLLIGLCELETKKSTPATAESAAGDFDAGTVDRIRAIGQAVAFQIDRRGAESLRDQAVGAGLDVALVDGEDAVRVCEIPVLAATAQLEARSLQLRAHGAIAEQGAFRKRFEQAFHIASMNHSTVRVMETSCGTNIGTGDW